MYTSVEANLLGDVGGEYVQSSVRTPPLIVQLASEPPRFSLPHHGR